MRGRNERAGNFGVLFGVTLTGLLGFGALAVDLSFVRNTRSQLRNAVDASAHAALIELRRTESTSAATAMAQSIAAQNLVGGKPLTLSSADVVYGQWDFTTSTFTAGVSPPNAVQVNATRDETSADGPIALFFAPIFGTTAAEGAASAVSAYRSREVMIVQDVTGTFQVSMDVAREADLLFLQYMIDNNFPGDRIGMTVFTGAGEVFTPLTSVESGGSSVYAQWNGDGRPTCDPCGTIWTSVFNEDLTGLTICFEGEWGSEPPAPFDADHMISCAAGNPDPGPGAHAFGTAPAGGLNAAIEEFDANGIAGNARVIVYVSDGRPQCYNLDTMTDSCAAARGVDGQNAALDAAARGISIYPVSICEGCSASARTQQFAYNETLVAGYGRAYTTDDYDDLPSILLDIAKAIPVAIVQ